MCIYIYIYTFHLDRSGEQRAMVPFRPSEVVVDGTCYRIVSIYILKKDAIRYDQYIDYRRSPWNARLADGGREGGERGEGRGAERRGACRYVRVP